MRRILCLCFAVLVPVLPAARPAGAEAKIALDVGGGLIAGGYFEELRHDWRVGPGGTLFVQLPLQNSLEARLSGSMQWNDGTLREATGDGEPNLGQRPGDLTDTFRRTSVEAALLWRVEPRAIGQVGVPYVGAGVSTYELAAKYSTPEGDREWTEWEPGGHFLAGVRFYRTSGLFLSMEGKLHGIDAPDDWIYAYEGAVLIGWMIGP
ncbi:MAG: hypothetical protein GF346_09900 [Candidatus Eisenbacteria bacterium]|nr:hypothetical protein [Candidatus Latescibacterota bacterium]MBD3302747.1 hypothetical protein [Candidatus Eisenbacteria bacterium]